MYLYSGKMNSQQITMLILVKWSWSIVFWRNFETIEHMKRLLARSSLFAKFWYGIL